MLCRFTWTSTEAARGLDRGRTSHLAFFFFFFSGQAHELPRSTQTIHVNRNNTRWTVEGHHTCLSVSDPLLYIYKKSFKKTQFYFSFIQSVSIKSRVLNYRWMILTSRCWTEIIPAGLLKNSSGHSLVTLSPAQRLLFDCLISYLSWKGQMRAWTPPQLVFLPLWLLHFLKMFSKGTQTTSPSLLLLRCQLLTIQVFI